VESVETKTVLETKHDKSKIKEELSHEIPSVMVVFPELWIVTAAGYVDMR